jgi:hypothetical protein
MAFVALDFVTIDRTTAFDDLALMSEIAELAEGWRQLTRKRAASRSVESWKSRLTGDTS